tara:strand:- start:175 stop:393 length:219 start_codon:yes stop_codon:yes gene_type:complete
MFSIQYSKGQFINAEEISTLDTFNPSGFIFFQRKNSDFNFRVEKDYEELFLNDFKTLDANNPGNKLTRHKYK